MGVSKPVTQDMEENEDEDDGDEGGKLDNKGFVNNKSWIFKSLGGETEGCLHKEKEGLGRKYIVSLLRLSGNIVRPDDFMM